MNVQDRKPVISVTGTKGKTTTVNVISDVLQKLNYNVLQVNTTGHFVNGERRSTLKDSSDTWGLVPSVSPGRYLYEFFLDPGLKKDGVAVLECSLGCGSASGLGYKHHSVGVFLNVLEDHLGSGRIQSVEDIAIAKQFIFERIDQGGYAVFNADDKMVLSRLDRIRQEVQLIPIGIKFDKYDIDGHHKSGGLSVTVDSSNVVLRSLAGDVVLASLNNIPWAFGGSFEPSKWNLMAAAAAVVAYSGGQVPDGLRDALESTRLDPYGGRLTVLGNAEGVTILADYAHEKYSLSLVGDLARTLTSPGGKVIGIVRLAHDRTDELVRDTARIVAGHYDKFIVYEKIDGYWRKAVSTGRKLQFPQIEGRTSQVFTDALKEKNSNVERIVREDEAIDRAVEIAKSGDVVVLIVNDDTKRSVDFLRDKFGAEFK